MRMNLQADGDVFLTPPLSGDGGGWGGMGDEDDEPLSITWHALIWPESGPLGAGPQNSLRKAR